LKSFVEKYGTAVLAAPAFSGLFNKTALADAIAALVIGLAGLVSLPATHQIHHGIIGGAASVRHF
jgi:hypothetical protein